MKTKLNITSPQLSRIIRESVSHVLTEEEDKNYLQKIIDGYCTQDMLNWYREYYETYECFPNDNKGSYNDIEADIDTIERDNNLTRYDAEEVYYAVEDWAKRQILGHLSENTHRMTHNNINEDYCWWGDTKPLKTIIQCCNELINKSNFSDPNFEGDADDAAEYHLYDWAKKVAQDAEEYLSCNAHNVSINGGENW